MTAFVGRSTASFCPTNMQTKLSLAEAKKGDIELNYRKLIFMVYWKTVGAYCPVCLEMRQCLFRGVRLTTGQEVRDMACPGCRALKPERVREYTVVQQTQEDIGSHEAMKKAAKAMLTPEHHRELARRERAMKDRQLAYQLAWERGRERRERVSRIKELAKKNKQRREEEQKGKPFAKVATLARSERLVAMDADKGLYRENYRKEEECISGCDFCGAIIAQRALMSLRYSQQREKIEDLIGELMKNPDEGSAVGHLYTAYANLETYKRMESYGAEKKWDAAKKRFCRAQNPENPPVNKKELDAMVRRLSVFSAAKNDPFYPAINYDHGKNVSWFTSLKNKAARLLRAFR